MKSKVTVSSRTLVPKPIRRFPLTLKLSPKARRHIFYQTNVKQFTKLPDARELLSTTQTLEKYLFLYFQIS